MVNINKGNSPATLVNYRREQIRIDRDLTGKNIFDDFRNKDELRTLLIKEQGYLCAYCMQRIKNDPLKSKIEHCKSQDEFSAEKLNYANLLLCCKGNEGQKKENHHCDTKKGKDTFHFNPSESRHNMEQLIKYGSRGSISSDNTSLDFEMNNILNLNEKMLKMNRESVQIAVETALNKNSGTRTRSEIVRLINKWSKLTDGKYKAYYGVAIYKLKKHPSY